MPRRLRPRRGSRSASTSPIDAATASGRNERSPSTIRRDACATNPASVMRAA